MSLQAVTMYRVVCDEPGCTASANDDTEFYAWSDHGAAYDSANDGDWTVRPGLDLCPDHGSRKLCMGNDEKCPRRDVSEAADGWMYCPEHLERSDA